MIKRNDIIWQQVPYLKIGGTNRYEFELKLPEPLASWDVFDDWEKERVRSIQQNLDYGDILFDIGAEAGWLSVIYGQIVHPSNMVLIEPTPEFWGNIEAIWHKNFDCEPLAMHCGLFSNKTTNKNVLKLNQWPEPSNNDLIDKLSYTLIHDNPKKVAEITLDDYVKQTGIVPDALTIDTEGSELLILQGADKALAKRNLKIWVSIHPDLSKRDYNLTKEQLLEFMAERDYQAKHLATDHEEHWFFTR